MKYLDRVYGEVEINEPVVLELMSSSTMQRLKGVHQGGWPTFSPRPEKLIEPTDHSRYAHCVGVYLLLKKFSTPLPEQVAGLIHDVSHTTFSHCMDHFKNMMLERNFQDSIHNDYVKKSDIPAIVKKYGLDIDYILEDKNLPLKERALPDLCADRIDYILRGALIFEELSPTETVNLLGSLMVHNNEWCFRDYANAKKYRDLFIRMNTVYYASIQTAAMFKTIGDVIGHALKHGYIAESDFFTEDKLVMNKIATHLGGDPELGLLYRRLSGTVPYNNDPKNFESKVVCKSRAVDPLFLNGGKLKRVSDVDLDWKEGQLTETKPKIYYLHFED